jgi:O-antigen/teichoic acid export membrane protein
MLLSIIPSLISAIVVIILGRKYIKIKILWDSDAIKTIVFSSLPFFALTASGLLYTRIDLLMLKTMDSNQAAGLYNAAYKIIFFLFVIPVSVRSAIYPMLSNYHKNQQDKLLFAISKTIKYMMIISTLISILIFLYADSIINLLFGKEFIISAECLKILIWMFIPYCGYIITMYYLNARGDVKYVMKISILGLVLNILLNYYLIPAYSLKGAAIATLITEIIVFIGLMLKAIKEYNAVNSGHFIIKLSFITLSGLYFALYLPYYYIGLFFICYFTLLIYLLHIIDSEERYALKFIFKLFIDKFRRV